MINKIIIHKYSKTNKGIRSALILIGFIIIIVEIEFTDPRIDYRGLLIMLL